VGLRVSTLIFILLWLTSDVSNKVCILQTNLACRDAISKHEESFPVDHSGQEISANNKTIRNSYSVIHYVYTSIEYRAKFRLKLTGIKITFASTTKLIQNTSLYLWPLVCSGHSIECFHSYVLHFLSYARLAASIMHSSSYFFIWSLPLWYVLDLV